MFLLFMILGALLNRHRGGLFPLKHGQIARIDYAIGLSLMLWYASGTTMISLICPVLFFLGSLAPNGAWMNVRTWLEVLHGSLSGLVNVGLVVGLLVISGYDLMWWPLLLAGLLKGPLYLVAQTIPDSGINHFRRGPEVGEALFGAALGLGVYLV